MSDESSRAPKFDVDESRRLREAVTASRVQVRAAHDKIMSSFRLLLEGKGPGPTQDEIDQMNEVVQASQVAARTYWEFLENASQWRMDSDWSRRLFGRSRG